MGYLRHMGEFQPGVYGMPGRPDSPFAVPGPFSPGIPGGATPATTPYALFPRNVKVGDVVNVSGDFRGVSQGQAVVRFAGASGEAIAIQGAFGGSIVVPEGAQTGACQIELNGRTVFGGSCVVAGGSPSRARAPQFAAVRSWRNFGSGTALAEDSMGYIRTGLGEMTASEQAAAIRKAQGTPSNEVVKASRAGTGQKRDTSGGIRLDNRIDGGTIAGGAVSSRLPLLIVAAAGAAGLFIWWRRRKKGLPSA